MTDLAGQRKLKPEPEMGRQATNKQQAHWHCGARKGLRMKVLTVSEDGNRVVMWGKKKDLILKF